MVVITAVCTQLTAESPLNRAAMLLLYGGANEAVLKKFQAAVPGCMPVL